MKNLDITKETKKYCRELNKRVPCKTQEDVDECARMLEDYFSKHAGTRLFWETELWLDCGMDATVARQKLMYSGQCKFCASEDPISHPGIFVRYKPIKKGK
jgi:hypothetical protein